MIQLVKAGISFEMTWLEAVLYFVMLARFNSSSLNPTNRRQWQTIMSSDRENGIGLDWTFPLEMFRFHRIQSIWNKNQLAQNTENFVIAIDLHCEKKSK